MKTYQVKVYNFVELNEQAKDKAIEWYRNGCMDLDYELCNEDFKNNLKEVFEENGFCNVEIEDYDLSYYKNRPYLNIKYAGIDLNKFISERQKWIKNADIDFSIGRNELEVYKQNVELSKRAERIVEILAEKIQDKFNEVKANIIKNGLANIEYVEKDETIAENIIANEYEFLENGMRY